MKKKLFAMLFVIAASFIVHANTVHAAGSSLLRQGMSSDKVKALQTDLKTLGFYNYNVTGYFGSITLQSVKKYQAVNKLSVDGIVGAMTQGIKADKY